MNINDQIMADFEKYMEARTAGFSEVSKYTYRAGYYRETINQLIRACPEARALVATHVDAALEMLPKYLADEHK